MSSFDPYALARPALLDLRPYQPGKPISACQRELGREKFIKLASNENPLGSSPEIVKALPSISDVARYPDADAFELKQALAEHLKIETNQLALGNGSEDVLKMLFQAFLWGDNTLLVPQYSFIAYKLLAKGLGIKVNEFAVNKDFTLNLRTMLNAITVNTRMIVLANPNNPTGTYVNALELKAFLEAVPKHILVVIDEAYYEYCQVQDYPQTLTWLSEFPNLVVTRTFSKVYGLAGLRVGYGIAHPGIIDLANRVRQPFNVNMIAQHAARLALADKAFVAKSIRVNSMGKKQFESAFSAMSVEWIPSLGNFIMIRAPKGLCQAMLTEGIIIRPLAPYQLEDHVRISIGTEEENKHCIDALEKCLLNMSNGELVGAESL